MIILILILILLKNNSKITQQTYMILSENTTLRNIRLQCYWGTV